MHLLVGFAAAVLSCVVLFIGAFYLRPAAFRVGARPERARCHVAEKMGFSCCISSDANEAFLKTLLGFSLFSHKDDVRITLSMRKHAPGVEIAVCDCRCATGFAYLKKVHKETVLVFRSDRLVLPSFSLYTRTTPRRLLDHAFSRHIDVTGHPLFSKRYLLHGSDEETIIGVFNAPVLRLLEEMKPLNLEGRGDTLIMYRSSAVVPASHLEGFVQEGQMLLDVFARS